jgi:hypothetical protein
MLPPRDELIIAVLYGFVVTVYVLEVARQRIARYQHLVAIRKERTAAHD